MYVTGVFPIVARVGRSSGLVTTRLDEWSSLFCPLGKGVQNPAYRFSGAFLFFPVVNLCCESPDSLTFARAT